MHLDIKYLPPHSESTIPFVSVCVPAGEASEVSAEFCRVDLNEFVTGGKEGFFTVRIIGNSMETEIRHGDLVIVNTNLSPNSGDVVVVEVNGAHTVKIYQPFRNGLRLVPANKQYQTKTVTPKDSCEVFGVVTGVFHTLKKN